MGLEEADRLGTETVDRVRRHFCVTSSVHQQHAELTQANLFAGDQNSMLGWAERPSIHRHEL